MSEWTVYKLSYHQEILLSYFTMFPQEVSPLYLICLIFEEMGLLRKQKTLCDGIEMFFLLIEITGRTPFTGGLALSSASSDDFLYTPSLCMQAHNQTMFEVIGAPFFFGYNRSRKDWYPG